ncbi:HK97 family phage prohead protease, partial [Priestia megaterium]|uniref:HK97 family phage prohead protease n=1 Tax=Priestia megaterium TaxID=1404 RepID=UPI0030089FD5
MEKQKEIRKIDVESIETRATESNDYLIEGYINKFGQKSQFMGFFEQVDSKAFNRTLAQGHNIFGMYNHSSDKILGSTRTGSLKLSVDKVGLHFSLQINPNVSYAKDVYELVR